MIAMDKGGVIGFFEEEGGKDFLRGTPGCGTIVKEKDYLLGEPIGKIDIVEAYADSLPFCRKPLEEFSQFQLFPRVQVGRRFIKQNEGCVLAYGPGYKDLPCLTP